MTLELATLLGVVVLAGTIVAIFYRTTGALGSRVTALEVRMDNLEGRMDRLETRMDRLETRMDRLEAKVDGVADMFREFLMSTLAGVSTLSTQNPHDRRQELLDKLTDRTITADEGKELREIIERDLKASDKDDTAKNLLLLALGIALIWALAKD